MKPFLILLFCFLSASISTYAQKGEMIKLESGLSYNFMVDGEQISGKKAKKLISVDPEALYSFENARQNRTVSHVFGGLGVAGLIYSSAAMVNEELDTKWGIFAGSIVLVGFAIPLYISADRQMCGALTKYNQRFKSGTSYFKKPKKSVQFTFTGNSAGLVLKF